MYWKLIIKLDKIFYQKFKNTTRGPATRRYIQIHRGTCFLPYFCTFTKVASLQCLCVYQTKYQFLFLFLGETPSDLTNRKDYKENQSVREGRAEQGPSTPPPVCRPLCSINHPRAVFSSLVHFGVLSLVLFLLLSNLQKLFSC